MQCRLTFFPVSLLWYPIWYTPSIFTSAVGKVWNTALDMYSKYAGANSRNICSSVREISLITNLSSPVFENPAPLLPPVVFQSADADKLRIKPSLECSAAFGLPSSGADISSAKRFTLSK